MNTFFGCDVVNFDMALHRSKSDVTKTYDRINQEEVPSRKKRVPKMDPINKKIFCEHIPEQLQRQQTSMRGLIDRSEASSDLTQIDIQDESTSLQT